MSLVGGGIEGPWPLVGRDAELRRISDALAAGSRLVTVHGAAGVGKSRLLAEAASAASDAGYTDLRVQGNAVLKDIPLGALSPLFSARAALDEAPADATQLFTQAAERTAELGAGSPVLLVVDDVTLLDKTSVTLIAQLAAAGAVSLLVSAVPEMPLPDSLVALWSVLTVTRVDLAAFDEAMVGELVEKVLGGQLALRSAAHLHEISGGNLLHLRELTLTAVAQGALRRVDGAWRLAEVPEAPPSLRDLVLARIRSLDPEAQDVVERLAVCGEIPVDQLPGEAARAALGHLESIGMATIAYTATGLVAQLANPATASVIDASMPMLRRADILGQQADRVVRGTLGDELRAITWSVAAGRPADASMVRPACRMAREAGDFPTVLRLADAGLRGGRDVSLLLFRGEALLRMGRVHDALETLSIAERDAPPELLPTLAAVTGLAHAHRIGGRADGLRVVERAAQEVGQSDQLLALTRALILLLDERVDEAEQQVRSIASATDGDDVAQALVAAAQAMPLAALGKAEEALAAATVATRFAQQAEARVDGLSMTETQRILGEVLLLDMRVREARGAATNALLESFGDDDELNARATEWLLARVCAYADLDAAERWALDALSGAATLGPEHLVPAARALLAVTLAAKGDLERAASFAESSGGAADGVGVEIAPLWVRACAGEVSAAIEPLLALSDRVAEQGHRVYAAGVLGYVLELDRAEAVGSRARILADSCSSGFISLLADQVDAVLGKDATALLRIADSWEASGALRFAATASAQASRVHRTAGEARAAASAQSRAEDLAQRCGGLATPVLRFGEELSQLTRREREIANLAASGASSKDIAAKLFLSTRTVDNHLQSVYGKLGISGRHELTPR